MRYWIIMALGFLLLAGCASKPPEIPAMPVENLEQSSAIVVEDLRPETEGKSETFSVNIMRESYGIYRVDEAFINPPAPRLLAHRAFEAFPELADAPLIKLYHLVVYTNLKSHLRKYSAGMTFLGAVGGLLVSSKVYQLNQVFSSPIDDAAFFDNTAKKEHRRAFYTEEENPDDSPTHLIYIDTEMLGKRIASRCLIALNAYADSAYPMTEKTDACIQKHLALYQTLPNVGQ